MLRYLVDGARDESSNEQLHYITNTDLIDMIDKMAWTERMPEWRISKKTVFDNLRLEK